MRHSDVETASESPSLMKGCSMKRSRKQQFTEIDIRRRLSVNLKRIREARGMSISALAEASRLHEHDIVNIEKRAVDIWVHSPRLWVVRR
jgi:ribosome-binding protein aMBF1 (putative translation factor)